MIVVCAKPVLVVDDLRVAYGSMAALHGVSLEIHAGETVALIGANGARKSTTLRAFSGLLKVPSSGRGGRSTTSRRIASLLQASRTAQRSAMSGRT